LGLGCGSFSLYIIDEISTLRTIASEGNSVTGKEPISVRMGIMILNCLKRGAKAIGKQRYPEVEVKGKKRAQQNILRSSDSKHGNKEQVSRELA
jgi:hypothetical protein